MFALHAGIAIENARLHEQVQRLAIVEERERIGRDLHDGIIQSIYAVGLSLEDVPDLMEDEPDVARARVEHAIDSLDQSIRDIRNFIFGLRPELLEQAGLLGGLAALADEFRVNSMVDVDVETYGVEDVDLSPDQTGQLLSIAREALSNIARHSKATRGTVSVEASRTPASTSRSSAWPSSRSASGSAAISTTGSSRASTPWVSRSRRPDLMEDEPEVARARVERAIDSLDQSIRDIRNFIFGLRPELLEQAGPGGRPGGAGRRVPGQQHGRHRRRNLRRRGRGSLARPDRPAALHRPRGPQQRRPPLQGDPRDRPCGGRTTARSG